MLNTALNTIVDTFPLSPSQQAMWMIHKLFPDGGIYNTHFVWDIPINLNIERLKSALEQVIERHPSLRTTYDTDAQGGLCQQVRNHAPLQFERVSALGLDDNAFNQRIDLELQRSFTLEKMPPMRWIHFTRSHGPDSLAVIYHHIMIDLWGHMVLMNDLEKIYTEISANNPSTLPPPPQTLKQFVLEQEMFLASAEGKRQAEFWQHQLDGLPSHLEIPSSLPRPALRTCRQKNFYFEVPTDAILALQQALAPVSCGAFTQFEALFHAFLYRYTQQPDIFIGTPTAGRDDRYAGVFGYFNNSIVIRNTVDPSVSFLDFLRQHNTVIESSLSSQHYPFSMLTHFVAEHRDPSRAPIVQFYFVWENINRFENRHEKKVTLSQENREIWNLGTMGDWVRYARIQQLDDVDLTLKIQKYGSQLNFCFTYNSDLFDVANIARMAGHFVTFMRSIAETPSRPMSQLHLLTASERQSLVKDWNNTDTPYDKHVLLPAFVRALSHRQPDATAIDAGGHTLTYAMLEQASNRIANYLLAKNIRRHPVIGLYLDRTPEILCCILGIMKAGAAYLPLDPHYPSERLHYIVTDAAPTFILCHQRHAADINIRPNETRLLCWEDTELLQSPSHPPDIQLSETDTAYIIYTSGSTGRPKGVAVAHANLCHLMCALKVFQLNSNDRLLQFASINFDASMFEMVAALQAGATLVMSQKTELLGPNLLHLLKSQRVSWAVLPPALLSQIDPAELPELHSLIAAGDACPLITAQKWAAGRRFFNAYGPTETTIWATLSEYKGEAKVSIGTPIANTQIYILDQHLNPQPLGLPGEIFIGGDGVAQGYRHQPGLTAEKFIADPFIPGGRVYKTGDFARLLDNGNIEILGRIDNQLKIRGYRIEPGEIEAILREHPGISDALVIATTPESRVTPGEKTLVAYLVQRESPSHDVQQLRSFLRQRLPDYMVPTHFVWLDAFPLTPNEKIDRNALPLPKTETKTAAEIQSPRNEIERILANTWKACLDLNDVSITENFFDLGGHSLLLAKVHAKLPAFLQEKLTLVDLYKYPTIQSLAHFLESDVEEDQIFVKEDEHVIRMQLRRRLMAAIGGVKIAIVGMAGRFPGADTIDEFWQNICDKKENIRFFSPDELREAGVPEDVIRQPNYVPAKGILNDVAGFDADFFNFTPREARITDPQQRLFLECAWQALEDAGCAPSRFKGLIGVYGGVGINQYLANNLSTHPQLLARVGDYAVMLGNDKDFLCTRVSYKLNLNGPAMVVQTACSTSLVAVHIACQALLSEECDAALAGGVSLSRYGNQGYYYHDGMIMSPDGHCRAFDAAAAGTVQGQGCGVVLLKRLDDALRDNDHIYAVISGSATNNDGSNKTGYTAPSVEGQAKAIRLAHASANIKPSKITYVEAHGTGTPIGDPIEIEALRQTFREEKALVENGSGVSGFAKTCAIGSVKTNIGHLDAAAGVAGLIKAALALRYRKLPPSLHFKTPNPNINFHQSPFYVNTELRDWQTGIDKRVAAVSSFGMGGTNAHIILTEPPSETPADISRPWRLVTLSARTATALEAMTERFVEHLKKHPAQDFANVCYTLHAGRTLFEHRRYLVCRNREEALAELAPVNSQRVITTQANKQKKKLVFLFSGQGSQYVDMGVRLYQTETTFRTIINECRSLVSQKFIHVYEELSEADASGRTQKINETFITQPALFIFEYALAKTLMSWGITPDYMIGHSVGEYVAACLAGVFTLDQALELVAIRGQLIQQLDGGDMLSVRLSEAEASLLTNHDVSLAAVNGEQRCVLSGAPKAIQYLHEQLNKRGIENRILHTSHAFHSHMMDPVLERFANYVQRRQPQAPKQPFISSLTGEWITSDQAMSPQYWANHLRHTVRFHQGLNTLFAERQQDDSQQTLIFLEVGPGQALTTLTRQHCGKQTQDWVLATTRHAYDEISDSHHLLKVLGRLWEQGIDIQWDVFHSDRQRYRVPLPTYPFERSQYWVKAVQMQQIQDELGIDAPMENVTPPYLVNASVQYTRPRDALEETVWKTWTLCFGREDFGIYDNFFDLGGDSLLAVNLLDLLRQQFKAPLSTPVLIQQPTVADLADHIQRHGAQTFSDTAGMIALMDGPLVMIQRGNATHQPLLMVHPIGGEVFFYRDLARHLGNEQPVYAFQAPGLSGIEPPINSVYALAKRYISAMKERGFGSPYLLGGSSFGGLVAYEMAQQLQSHGEDVRLVIMIDTPAPRQMPRNLTDSAAILQYLLQGQLSLSLEKLRSLPAQAQIDYALEEARLQGKGNALPPHLGIPMFQTWIAHQEATFAYRPEAYRDDVVFFQHTEPMENFPSNPSEAWESLIEGAMRIHHVPSNHISMNYPPHVKTLASHLKHILRGYTGQ